MSEILYKSFVAIDNLSSPTDDDCHVVKANHGCYIQLDWLVDGTSEVYYMTDPNLPYDSILAIIERQFIVDNLWVLFNILDI